MSKLLFTTLNTVQALTTPIVAASNINGKNLTQDFELLKFYELLSKISINGTTLTEENFETINTLENVHITITLIDTYQSDGIVDVQNAVNHYTMTNKLFLKFYSDFMSDEDTLTFSELSPRIYVKIKDNENLFDKLVKLSILDNVQFISVNDDSGSYTEGVSLTTSNDVVNNIRKNILYKSQYDAIGITEEFLKKDDKNPKIIESNKIKVGLMEVGDVIDRDNIWFENTDVFYDNEDSDLLKSENHADHVASIIAGENGINKNDVSIYSIRIKEKSINHGFNLERYAKKIEWLIKIGVSIINHSYGNDNTTSFNKKVTKIYGSSFEYYLDFISRKNGIVNVFAVGNGFNDVDSKAVVGYTLSQNRIAVGSTTADGREKSDFSEARILDPFITTKPLVVAPGEMYLFLEEVNNKNSWYTSGRGTSFSAPIVTALIANLYTEFPDLKFHPEKIMAILSAGTNEVEYYHGNQLNGLNNEVGAGLINYKKMLEATKNLNVLTLNKKGEKQIINLKIIEAKKHITFSLNWLFDARYSKKVIKKKVVNKLRLARNYFS